MTKAADLAALKELIAKHRTELAKLLRGGRGTGKDDTMLKYAEWYVENGNALGVKQALAAVRAALETTE